ncbi:MAG: septal ring lytic transglycosylase RlpA family protein [Pontibacterium sp.]
MKQLGALLIVAFLAGCSSSGGRYAISQDRGPEQAVNVASVQDAVPRVEKKSRGGNKSPYRVLGKTYYVLESAAGYKEQGGASWYGKKFHGHTTSNGEVYDMYAMTAAHKSLPLPAYVRVTNLTNDRQVIVRVNDRGPFHPGRIIDLSYAAAAKLDMLRSGTARVEVEVLDPRAWQKTSLLSSSQVSKPVRAVSGRYLQVGAYSSRITAERVVGAIRALTGEPMTIRTHDRGDRVLYRVHVGPVVSDGRIRELLAQLEGSGYSGSRLVDLN